MGIARIHPTVTYAPGHSNACTRLGGVGTPVMFDHGRGSALTAVRTS